MKRSYGFALLFAGVIACDAWFATEPSQSLAAVVGDNVTLLGLLQVGPAVPSVGIMGIIGGAECDCHGVETEGEENVCEAEPMQDCTTKHIGCEPPTAAERCTMTCNVEGCVSIARLTSSSQCDTEENCGGGH